MRGAAQQADAADEAQGGTRTAGQGAALCPRRRDGRGHRFAADPRCWADNGGAMRGNTGLTGAAWVTHALAWFLPVHKYGVRLPHGIPGWQAFRIAVSPLWPYEGSESGPWYGAALTTSGGLTNLVLLASLPILLTGSGRASRALGWAALAASII